MLSLHAQQLTAWSEAVTRSIRPGMSDAAFARTFFNASRADPTFLDLAARLGNVLEQNVSAQRLIESKQTLHALLVPLATHIERCLKLSTGSGVTALTSLTVTLLGAVQLDAGPPLKGPEVPREVRELRNFLGVSAGVSGSGAAAAGWAARSIMCAPQQPQRVTMLA